jgi:hypothetical protein
MKEAHSFLLSSYLGSASERQEIAVYKTVQYKAEFYCLDIEQLTI